MNNDRLFSLLKALTDIYIYELCPLTSSSCLTWSQQQQPLPLALPSSPSLRP